MHTPLPNMPRADFYSLPDTERRTDADGHYVRQQGHDAGFVRVRLVSLNLLRLLHRRIVH